MGVDLTKLARLNQDVERIKAGRLPLPLAVCDVCGKPIGIGNADMALFHWRRRPDGQCEDVQVAHKGCAADDLDLWGEFSWLPERASVLLANERWANDEDRERLLDLALPYGEGT